MLWLCYSPMSPCGMIIPKARGCELDTEAGDNIHQQPHILSSWNWNVTGINNLFSVLLLYLNCRLRRKAEMRFAPELLK